MRSSSEMGQQRLHYLYILESMKFPLVLELGSTLFDDLIVSSLYLKYREEPKSSAGIYEVFKKWYHLEGLTKYTKIHVLLPRTQLYTSQTISYIHWYR